MEKRNLASPISHQDITTISLKRLCFRGKSLKQMADMLSYQPILFPKFKGIFFNIRNVIERYFLIVILPDKFR